MFFHQKIIFSTTFLGSHLKFDSKFEILAKFWPRVDKLKFFLRYKKISEIWLKIRKNALK